MKPQKNPIRFREAWQGIRALIADPDDTSQVFKIIRALSGNSGERAFQRFLNGEHGPQILAERRSLVTTLSDRAALMAMPAGSFGRTYAEFTAREEITPDGLVDASESVPAQDGPVCRDRELFGTRLRDSHDLWHVLTGFGRDLVGEAGLLAFTYHQTGNRGIGFIVAVAYLKAGRTIPEQRVVIREGYRLAKQSNWLPGADWEALLPLPLDEARARLGIVPVSDYPVFRSEGAPAVA
ncbi:MAG: Coq4 family protein [Myxococcota bacterium]